MPRKSFDEDCFRQQADVLNIVLDHITQGMVVVGPDYRMLAFNRHFEEIFQLSHGTVEIGFDFREILKVWARETGQNQEMLDLAIKELDTPSTFEFEFPQEINGAVRWCQLTHNPLPNKGGFVRTFTDITKRKLLEASLIKLSQEDPLTGLYNRRTLMGAIEDEVLRRQRYQRPISLLIIDIDHFKCVNDQWGHPVGDAVLKAFAAACLDEMRDNDKVGRWGGEEFIILLPETGRDEAELVANRLRSRIGSLRIEAHSDTDSSTAPIQITISIGISSATPDDSVDMLLKRADDALYDAKSGGRNCVAYR